MHTFINSLFSQAHFLAKGAWVSMLFFIYSRPMLVDFEIILCVCMLGSIATISHNNVARRHNLSLLTVLLLFSFSHSNFEKKKGKSCKLQKMSLAIIGLVAVKKTWFTRLIIIMHRDICSRQQ